MQTIYNLVNDDFASISKQINQLKGKLILNSALFLPFSAFFQNSDPQITIVSHHVHNLDFCDKLHLQSHIVMVQSCSSIIITFFICIFPSAWNFWIICHVECLSYAGWCPPSIQWWESNSPNHEADLVIDIYLT